ncbi:hypothetical protein BDD12DRAFT_811119, partial [Trichophaea hybrida]
MYQLPPKADMPGPPPEHLQMKPSKFQLTYYARNPPRQPPTSSQAVRDLSKERDGPSLDSSKEHHGPALDSSKEHNGPDVIWTSYKLPPPNSPKRLIPTERDYTFKPGTKFDHDGLPITQSQFRVDIISERHGGVPVHPRTWDLKTNINSKGMQGSKYMLPSLDSQDDTTFASSNSMMSPGSFTPHKDRPNMARNEPKATVYPGFREGGPDSAVYRTNFDLNTGDDPYGHGKAYWAKEKFRKFLNSKFKESKYTPENPPPNLVGHIREPRHYYTAADYDWTPEQHREYEMRTGNTPPRRFNVYTNSDSKMHELVVRAKDRGRMYWYKVSKQWYNKTSRLKKKAKTYWKSLAQLPQKIKDLPVQLPVTIRGMKREWKL